MTFMKTLINMFFRVNYIDFKMRQYINSKCLISGEHISGNLLLPIITIKTDVCIITMKYNFNYWCINTFTHGNFDLTFPDELFKKDICIDENDFEGFNKQFLSRWSFNESKLNGLNNFSCYIKDKYNLYTFMFMLKQQLNRKDE